jgi:EF hand
MKLTTLAISLALAVPGIAQAQEGKELAELVFESIDGAGRGFFDMGEFTNFGGDVFHSMDQDEDGKVTLDEFMAWSFGASVIAEETDRTLAYETAMRVVFAFWDRNGDGELTRTEHRKALVTDFQRADFDGNMTVEKDEFLNGFSMNIAARAALEVKE